MGVPLIRRAGNTGFGRPPHPQRVGLGPSTLNSLAPAVRGFFLSNNVATSLRTATNLRTLLMSQRAFERDLIGHALRAGGSHDTIAARTVCMRALASYTWSAGFQLATIQSLRTRHVRAWVESMKEAELTTRTIQNAMAHVRTVLRGAGRAEFADKDLPSNAALGLSGASRAGTKIAIPNLLYQQMLAQAETVDPCVAAAFALCRQLGLRSKEAVMSAQSLPAWEKALLQGDGGVIFVCHGTKGGRLRALPVVALPDPPGALQAVQNARQCVKTNGGQLIPRSDLKTALARFHYVAGKIGMIGEHSPHSLRYAFACASIDHMKNRHGLSRAEANAAVSQMLGHGDGRGRYVERVYSRRRE